LTSARGEPRADGDWRNEKAAGARRSSRDKRAEAADDSKMHQRAPLLLSIVGLLSVALFAACADDTASDGQPTGAGSGGAPGAGGTSAGNGSAGGPAVTPTFHKDIAPLFDKHCNDCHRAGGIAPFSLTTYGEASANADVSVYYTESGLMPPWHAVETEACKPTHAWKDDMRLTAAEKALIKAWADAGAPEGDPADAPPPFVPRKPGLTAPTGTLSPKAPWVTSGNSDQFRCFVLDPALDKDAYLKGIAVLPGDPKVVHHALIFADEQRESLALADADGGYTCFGDSRTSEPKLVGAWAPGGVPEEFPSNAGIPLKAGSLLVMQVHYHPGGSAGSPDSTKLEVAFTEEKPAYTVFPLLLGNASSEKAGLLLGPDDRDGKAEFRIPANVAGHTEIMEYKISKGLLAAGGLPQELGVYSSATHMHWVGRDMRIEVQRGSEVDNVPVGTNECLLGTPDYDFSWQRSYRYDTTIEGLPKIRGGDTLRLSCTYDNTKANERLMGALMSEHITEPQDVTLGESTTNEMCIASLALIFPTP
jgi:hypothetical protein